MTSLFLTSKLCILAVKTICTFNVSGKVYLACSLNYQATCGIVYHTLKLQIAFRLHIPVDLRRPGDVTNELK